MVLFAGLTSFALNETRGDGVGLGDCGGFANAGDTMTEHTITAYTIRHAEIMELMMKHSPAHNHSLHPESPQGHDEGRESRPQLQHL